MTTRAADLPEGLSARGPVVVGLLAIVTLVFGFGGWAVGTRIDGAVLAPGRIIVERNRQIVQHPDGGVISDLMVKEGDVVSKGQVLIKLDLQLLLSELSVVNNQLHEVMARRGRYSAERDEADVIVFDPALIAAAAADPKIAELVEGQRHLFETRLESMRKSVEQLLNQQSQLQIQIDGVDAQMDAVRRQLELTQAETDVQQSLLDKGLAQGSRVLNLRREDARLSGMMGEAISRRAQAMERMAEIRIETLQMLNDRREEAITILRDMQITELELLERRSALTTRLARMDIRAPASGIVYDLRVFGPETVIRPADPLLFIVPQDRPLVIEAQVAPINVGDVHVGQGVVIRFRSINARTMPDLFGTVMRVSPDAFTEPATGQSYYRAEIVLPETELEKLPDGQIMIPGMQVDTFIRTGEHSPLAYLAAPLTQYFGTALR